MAASFMRGAIALPPDEPGGTSPDAGLVGEVESIDPDVIHLLMSRGFIPVIMPIGVGADGTAYHINSDAFAGELARTLHAEKLILMTNVPGIHGRDGKLAFVLTASEAEALLREGVVARTCVRAWGRRSPPCAKVCARCTSSTAACRAHCCSRF